MTRAYGAECCCVAAYFYLAACKCCDIAQGPTVFRVPVTPASPGTWSAKIETLDHGTTYAATVGYGFGGSPVTVSVVVDNVGGFGPDDTPAKVAAKFFAAFGAATFPVAMSVGFNAYTDELTITGPTSTTRTGGFFTVTGASGFGAATVVWANPGTQMLTDALAGGGVVLLEINQNGELGDWEIDPDSSSAIRAEFAGECFTLSGTDGGTLLPWRPFIGPESPDEPGRFNAANIEGANVFVPDEQPEDCDDELCQENNPDYCPVIYGGNCYSVSSVVEYRLQCTFVLSDSSTVAIDATWRGDMFFKTGPFKCEPQLWSEFAYSQQVLPGPTRNINILFSESNAPAISDNLWDSDAGLMLVSVTGVTVTRTFTSPVNWALVDGVCVVEEAP